MFCFFIEPSTKGDRMHVHGGKKPVTRLGKVDKSHRRSYITGSGQRSVFEKLIEYKLGHSVESLSLAY